MAWEKLKHILRRKEDRAPQSPDISRLKRGLKSRFTGIRGRPKGRGGIPSIPRLIRGIHRIPDEFQRIPAKFFPGPIYD